MSIYPEDYDSLIKAARRLAKKGIVSKDTLVIYVDKGGRLMRVPFEEAMRERGAELPSKRYFLNFSSLDNYEKAEEKVKRNLQRGISRRLDKIPNDFKNVVIIDEHSSSGRTLDFLKKAFQKNTEKDVKTVTFSSNRFNRARVKPDYNLKGPDHLSSVRHYKGPVEDASRSTISRTKVNKEGLKKYQFYVRSIKEEMVKTRPKSARLRRR